MKTYNDHTLEPENNNQNARGRTSDVASFHYAVRAGWELSVGVVVRERQNIPQLDRLKSFRGHTSGLSYRILLAPVPLTVDRDEQSIYNGEPRGDLCASAGRREEATA